MGLQLRQAADPSFSFKLAVECGLDACIIIVVNLLARRERFTTELDFVLCQVRLRASMNLPEDTSSKFVSVITTESN